MPIIYDLKKDLRYIEGKQEGKLEGKQEGELEGKQEKARTAIIRILKDNTLKLSVQKMALILDVSQEFVKKIQEELKNNPDLT